MSRLTSTDFAVANWLARSFNEIRYMLGLKKGKHRSIGFSTYEWVRVAQVSREC